MRLEINVDEAALYHCVIDVDTGREIPCVWADDETGEHAELIEESPPRKVGNITVTTYQDEPVVKRGNIKLERV